MYGYVTPDKPYLRFKDFSLFHAFYCGTCKRTGKLYGQCARMITNYDVTFLETLIFSYLGMRPQFDYKGCVLNPFKKKHAVVADETFDRLVAFNALLSYHNLEDDVVDGEGLKKLLPKDLLRKAYRRAKRKLPAVEEIIRKRYEELRRLEEARTDSADRAADPFGKMMRECVREILGEKSGSGIEEFSYHLGKFIYLIDAIDDLDKDFKKKHYNPYLFAYGDYGECADRAAFLSRHRDEIEGGLHATINRCIEFYNVLNLTEARELLDNIVYRGLRRKARMVLDGEKNASKEKI